MHCLWFALNWLKTLVWSFKDSRQIIGLGQPTKKGRERSGTWATVCGHSIKADNYTCFFSGKAAVNRVKKKKKKLDMAFIGSAFMYSWRDELQNTVHFDIKNNTCRLQNVTLLKQALVILPHLLNATYNQCLYKKQTPRAKVFSF